MSFFSQYDAIRRDCAGLRSNGSIEMVSIATRMDRSAAQLQVGYCLLPVHVDRKQTSVPGSAFVVLVSPVQDLACGPVDALFPSS